MSKDKEQLSRNLTSYMGSYAYPLLFAIPISPLVNWFEKYVFHDWEFVKYLVVLIIIDTLISWVYHIREKDFSSKGFGMILVKLFSYTALLSLGHILSSYTIQSNEVTTFTWINSLICTSLLIREGISIVENISKLNPNLVPTWLRKFLQDFDENGFIKKNKENG